MSYEANRTVKLPPIPTSERRKFIHEMDAMGVSPQAIATRLGIKRNRVLAVIREKQLAEPVESHRPDNMWSLSEDDRRVEIARQAANGARETLAALRRQSTRNILGIRG